MDHILKVWTQLFGGKEQLMGTLDHATVSFLQSRAPGHAQEDMDAVQNAFHKMQIFKSIPPGQTRQAIWRALQKTTTLIPTLYTLFEDIKYLMAPSKILRQLFPKTSKTVCQAMGGIFVGSKSSNQIVIQESEDAFRRQSGLPKDRFDAGYRQIWLCSWRHWTELIPECPRKEDNEKTPQPQNPSQSRWFQLGSLATKLGFESPQISQIISEDPDLEIAREVLVKARDPEVFEYDVIAFEDYVRKISLMFKSAVPKSLSPMPLTEGKGYPLDRRCGREYERAYYSNKKYLFLDRMQSTTTERRQVVSSHFVRAAIFFAFFGSSSCAILGQTDAEPDELPPIATTVQLLGGQASNEASERTHLAELSADDVHVCFTPVHIHKVSSPAQEVPVPKIAVPVQHTLAKEEVSTTIEEVPISDISVLAQYVLAAEDVRILGEEVPSPVSVSSVQNSQASEDVRIPTKILVPAIAAPVRRLLAPKGVRTSSKDVSIPTVAAPENLLAPEDARVASKDVPIPAIAAPVQNLPAPEDVPTLSVEISQTLKDLPVPIESPPIPIAAPIQKIKEESEPPAAAPLIVKIWDNGRLVEEARSIPFKERDVVSLFLKKERLGFQGFDTNGRALTRRICFDAIGADRTIILSNMKQVDIDELLVAIADSVHKQ